LDLGGGKEYIPYEKTVNIHEHKAPTDESVKILTELEEAAWSRICKCYLIDSTYVNAVFLTIWEDKNQLKNGFILAFKINDKQFEVHYSFREWELLHIGIKPTIQNIFREELKEYIAREILTPKNIKVRELKEEK
jgi:hypothetical protein